MRTRVDAEHRRGFEVRRADRALRSPTTRCCAARRSRTCRDASTRRRRSRRGARTARGNPRRSAARGARCAAAAVDVSSSSTSASTATGLPSTTISGLRSTAATSGRSSGEAREPDERRRDRGAVDGRFAPERSEQLLGREIVEQVVGVELGRAARAGTRRRRSPRRALPRRRTSRTDRTADRARGPAMSSREPRTIGATSNSTGPSSGRAAASSSRGRGAHRGRVRQPEANEPALGLVRDGVAAQLHHDRESRPRRPRREPRRRRRRRSVRRARARRTARGAASTRLPRGSARRPRLPAPTLANADRRPSISSRSR